MSKAREAEAEQVEVLYYWALTQLGLATLQQATETWRDVPASGGRRFFGRWLDATLSLVGVRRREAASLALTYYRLVRALRTGHTIAAPGLDSGRSKVTIAQLRADFIHSVDIIDPGVPEPDRPDIPDDADDSEVIPTETIPGLSELVKRLEREAAEEGQLNLSQLGPAALSKAEKELAGNDENGRDAKVIDIHRKAGARTAAAAERISMNAARGLVYSLAEVDKRTIGWVRYSQTGTPCGWCAMLISRGVVYKNATTAGSSKNADGTDAEDQDKYHDNCHCVAVPVFSKSQYDSSSLFDLNRQYHIEWPKVTRGLSGKAAVSAWRRYIREQMKQDAQTPAQAVA